MGPGKYSGYGKTETPACVNLIMRHLFPEKQMPKEIDHENGTEEHRLEKISTIMPLVLIGITKDGNNMIMAESVIPYLVTERDILISFWIQMKRH